MADDLVLNAGSGGATLATDEISSVHHQRVKVQWGVDGVATDVSNSNPLPISDGGGTITIGGTVTANAGSGNFTVVNGGTFAVQIDKFTAAAALTDNFANPTTTAVQSFGMLWDGSTWDRMLGNSTDGVLVNLGSNNDISGTVTANAGTNLNTSALALETGGNLATLAGAVSGTEFQVDVVASLPTGTNSIGQVTANAGSGTFTVDNGGTFAVQSTLSAETTKVIGTVNVSAAQTIAVTNAGTFATQATLQGANALIGDVGISGARTAGGTTIFRSIDLDEGALEVVKAGAGQIYWIHGTNTAATPVFLKIYNATSGTIGTGTPVLTFLIPSQGDSNGAGFVLSIPNGIEFSTGISIGASTGVADADTGAPATNSCIVNLGFA